MSSQRDTAVPDAYDAFLRGWENYRRGTPEDLVTAIPHFERAMQLDPDYSRAENQRVDHPTEQFQ